MTLKRRVADGEPRATPTTCPFCRSAKIMTASKQMDSSTYWLCQTCGQLWNVGRLLVVTRHGYGGR